MEKITRITRAEELPEWLTIQELSHWFPMGVSTFYRLVAEGKIPARRIGGRYFISREWVISKSETSR